VGLRSIAESDLTAILQDGTTGFGWEITVIDPAGTPAILTGFGNDISQLIDPDTGVAVSGRQASIALPISALTAAGLGLPRAVADGAESPWIVEFNDVGGTPHVFKVSESNPDRALGIVTCVLEAYTP